MGSCSSKQKCRAAAPFPRELERVSCSWAGGSSYRTDYKAQYENCCEKNVLGTRESRKYGYNDMSCQALKLCGANRSSLPYDSISYKAGCPFVLKKQWDFSSPSSRQRLTKLITNNSSQNSRSFSSYWKDEIVDTYAEKWNDCYYGLRPSPFAPVAEIGSDSCDTALDVVCEYQKEFMGFYLLIDFPTRESCCQYNRWDKQFCEQKVPTIIQGNLYVLEQTWEKCLVDGSLSGEDAGMYGASSEHCFNHLEKLCKYEYEDRVVQGDSTSLISFKHLSSCCRYELGGFDSEFCTSTKTEVQLENEFNALQTYWNTDCDGDENVSVLQTVGYAADKCFLTLETICNHKFQNLQSESVLSFPHLANTCCEYGKGGFTADFCENDVKKGIEKELSRAEAAWFSCVSNGAVTELASYCFEFLAKVCSYQYSGVSISQPTAPADFSLGVYCCAYSSGGYKGGEGDCVSKVEEASAEEATVVVVEEAVPIPLSVESLFQ